jgi:hypothetical protein
LDARVDSAKTIGQAYSQYAANPEVFVAGVQYALDQMLKACDQSDFWYDFHHHMAIDILERAKQGKPQ